MGVFDFLKKKPEKRAAKIKIEMVGYENGEKVELRQSEKKFDKEEWARQASIRLNIDLEIRPLENAMVGFATALKQKQKVDDEIVMLKSLIEYYEEIKQKCYAFGPDYIEYFTKTWAEIRAGRDDGPEYVTRYKKRLKYVQENYDKLLKQEILHEKESENLESRVLAILRKHESILQTDVYKNFDPIVKEDIKSILYFMEKNGRISREKSGRTYIIRCKK